ncbi:hypothetical protein BJV82DRAFT_602014 [Fennellomyces sp. T-0311]|nr:hypothetical protein BJV82DRAFT_602014 [Fennellomyces sp. T-0311]
MRIDSGSSAAIGTGCALLIASHHMHVFDPSIHICFDTTVLTGLAAFPPMRHCLHGM